LSADESNEHSKAGVVTAKRVLRNGRQV